MTSEIESLKTNEFQRRRKLRLQQVREQSNDIAKKIRQRASAEKLRYTGDLDANKQKEYFEKQEKLVKQLEVLYARGLENVGASHRSASEVIQQDNVPKVDLSKLRGKEAATELRRQRQEKLDEQKRLLDRKLKAREAANERSREKSSIVANKLMTKSSIAKDNLQTKTDIISDCATANENGDRVDQGQGEQQTVTTTDMATQWDFDGQPNEWEPAVPTLSLPKDDKDSLKESETDSKNGKNKRLDLFALSKEMPSSLRGGNTNIHTERVPVRPSLTLVSEYLQSRGLRLRESKTSSSNNKPSEDLHGIKQILQRTRALKPEVSGTGTNNIEKSRSNSQDITLNKKSSVTMYNHSTRNTQDIQCNDNKLVVRDLQHDEDAYSQAMRETDDNKREKEHHKKIQDIRSKVAMTKQSVEKEYKDTMNFLNSVPKDKCSKTMRYAYMDDKRQQTVKENRQHKLQQEYRKIEKECRRHHCNKNRNISKSPMKVNTTNDFEKRDLQYSWMPVPESDSNLAIHTIPTATRDGKSGNTVKFSKIDSYHEYRSRHKHTPPTKDTCYEKRPNKKVTETIINDKSSSDSLDSSSTSSDTSSVENLELDTNRKHRLKEDRNMSDAERIIIYKILDSKKDKKSKKNSKVIGDIAKSLISIEKRQKSNEYDVEEEKKIKSSNVCKETENRVSFGQLNEGIYKVVNENGNNITSMHFTDNQSESDKIEAGSNMQNAESCSCKKPTKEQIDRSKALHWDCGDESAARNPNVTCKSDNTSKGKEMSDNQPSATTSTSSYKTIKDDKPSIITDDGFIKLVDGAGKEAGKFYIGATGFFKDDAYEMVIQLKKKSGTNEKPVDESAPKGADEIDKIEVIKPTSDAIAVDKTVDEEVRDILSQTNPPVIIPKRLSPAKICKDVPITNIQQRESEQHEIQQSTDVRLTSNDISVPKPAAHTNNLVDKGVGTSFQLSYAVPSHVPKVDPVLRPATSICTQTTLSSPSHRPVLFHMSSSTSTAYMSPPEMILPQFLRKDFYLADDEVYEPIQRVEITPKEDFKRHYANCNCKHCTHSTRPSTRVSARTCHRKSEYGSKMSNTPPNTARSGSSGYRFNTFTHRHGTDTGLEYPTDKPKCKCLKCECRGRSKTCLKIESQKCKRDNVGNKRSNRNINMRVSTANTIRNKQKTSLGKKTSDSNINPLIRQYVNKLLNLNKEGLKVIEVVDQECSLVTTPGSSIINVPCNVDERKGPVEKKISLEQIKNMLQKQIIDEHKESFENKHKGVSLYINNSNKKIIKPAVPRKLRLKPVHKIKSLNISKHLLKTKNSEELKKVITKPVSTSSTDDNVNTLQKLVSNTLKSRSKSSPSPRYVCASESASRFTDSDITNAKKSKPEKKITKKQNSINKHIPKVNNEKSENDRHINAIFRSHRATTTTSPDSSLGVSQKYKPEVPYSMSTQTSRNVDSEVSFMKLAEGKLHNMEKIADLTEKCTQRLSSLAKVLEEVRKNKSAAYSQISTSDSTSDSDQKSDKGKITPIQSDTNPQDDDEMKISIAKSSIEDIEKEEIAKEVVEKAQDTTPQMEEYTPFLVDIPKPFVLKVPDTNTLQTLKSTETLNLPIDLNVTPEFATKIRPKPPPALSRIHLKHGQEFIIPHELSTVLEVDSPMSIKHKSQTSRSDIKNDVPDNEGKSSNEVVVNQEVGLDKNNEKKLKDTNMNPDLLQSNVNLCKQQPKSTSTESSDDSKLQMIDLKQFNEIMLEPFISIHEYAKQYNVESLDEGSNIEEIQKVDNINDDVSSLHSDGSLPDVIAELLKRNIITEPFRFDTASNINSTTVSSESTLSMLALSKVRKEKKRSSVTFQNKDNNTETSGDSLSISSNPDLENAFKKLGMGWASSTLRKTKERLALSSSSNTSSSSVSQFKINKYNPDIPALITDSMSSVLNSSKKEGKSKATNGYSRNMEQQTSLMNSMTVKEFLNNELAKKITFTNKSTRNDTEEEFVSLYETKMPEGMKDEHSMSSMPSASNNRARTSTPVQIFKSMTYHSSSSSNVSNGLFSNADDLSSVKMTSNSMKNHSTSDKDDLTIPNFSLRLTKGSDCSKSD